MALSTRIILGLFLGLLAGAIFGERMVHFKIVGDIFLGLLQMTVLPYILVALISAIGALTVERATLLARYGVKVVVVLWLLTLLMIGLASLSFPAWQSASYFNPGLLAPPSAQSMLDSLLPSNIFNSLGQSSVPAVVVFATVFGVALLQVPNKANLLDIVNATQRAIGGISGMVMKLAPLGVFAIAGKAAGTMDVQTMRGLYVFFVTLAAVCGLLTFWVFPTLVKSITPLKYGAVLGASKEAIITAFATGNLFIVLPIIAENTRALFLTAYEKESSDANMVDVVVPIAFALPVAGKLMALLFVLFAGWFSGDSVPVQDYPGLFFSGLTQLFGSSYAAVTTLLQEYRIPSEMFGLYLVAENILVNRLGAMTSVMFVVCLAALITSGALGRWQLKPAQLLRLLAGSIAGVMVLSLLLRFMFGLVGSDYSGYSEFIARDLLLPEAQQRVRTDPPSQLPVEPQGAVLQRIQARKKLRVGYYRDWLPYAFHNKGGKLVGLDIELAHQLARDLGVAIEFVKVYRKDVKRLLEVGYLDVASGVAMTPASVSDFTLASSHIDVNLAVLLPKEHRRYARKWVDIKGYEKVKLGVLNTYYLSNALKPALPKLITQQVASPREFLKGEREDLNAVIMDAAGASAWTLLYPEYGVVIPQPALPSIPMAMPLSPGDTKYRLYMDQWIKLRMRDGTINKLYDYWILGKQDDVVKPARWNLWDTLFNKNQN